MQQRLQIQLLLWNILRAVRQKVGGGPYLCRYQQTSAHVDDDVQISALDPFYEMDGRQSRYIGEVLEWYRGEEAGDLKKSETCLDAFMGKIWKCNQKVVTEEKINPKILVREKLEIWEK